MVFAYRLSTHPPLRAAHLPLLHFILVHVDGGDGVLGAGLHLPVHPPLGVLRPGLEQVHPLLGFDPAGNGEWKREKDRDESASLQVMIYVSVCVWGGVKGQRPLPEVLLFRPASRQMQFHT